MKRFRVIISDIYNMTWFVLEGVMWLLGMVISYKEWGVIGALAFFLLFGAIRLVIPIVRLVTDSLMCLLFQAPNGAFASKSGLIKAYQNTSDFKYYEMLKARLGQEDVEHSSADEKKGDVA